MIDIFIPSYKRSDNIKTLKYLLKIGYDPKKIHIVIDNESEEEREKYEETVSKAGANLYVFDLEESRKRYDYIHRVGRLRRSAGQARNMFHDIALDLGLEFICVMDDDTTQFQLKRFGKYIGTATLTEVCYYFDSVKELMLKKKIGLFGLPQTGDFIGGVSKKILINKVMNTTFINLNFVYRGERGEQDDDTSQFVNMMNEGLFIGSFGDGIALSQEQSATQKGGLTEIYQTYKLLHKSLVCPIQFPSAIFADKQEKNGGRIHHKTRSRYLYPKLMKVKKNGNIPWDTYPEDIPFTCEPKRKKDFR